MATCNDCFHYEACKKIFQIAFKDFTNYTFVKPCKLYKPAADVVEVVRCKDCEYFDRDYDDSVIGACSNKRQNIRCNENHFCSYGISKEVNETKMKGDNN